MDLKTKDIKLTLRQDTWDIIEKGTIQFNTSENDIIGRMLTHYQMILNQRASMGEKTWQEGDLYIPDNVIPFINPGRKR